MSTYAQIFTKNQYDLAKMVRQSQAWFEQEARLIKSQGRVQAYYLMRTGASQNRQLSHQVRCICSIMTQSIKTPCLTGIGSR